jgi:hypothetical protein
MKKLIIALCTLTFISTTILTSCKKYEDGPAFSLRTKKARLQGDWKIDSFSIDGVDYTDDFKNLYGANYTWDIEKGGEYRITGTDPDKGSWKFGEDKDDVYFTSDDPGSQEEAYRILRLANKELWLKQTQPNGEVITIKLKQ